MSKSNWLLRSRSLGLGSFLLLAAACGAPSEASDGELGSGPDDAPEIAEGELPLVLGTRGPTVRLAHDQLMRSGYFPNEELTATFPGWQSVLPEAPADPERFDTILQQAVVAFQTRYALEPNGQLDEGTLGLMFSANCGTPDSFVEEPGQVSKFAYLGGSWSKTTIKFKFGPFPWGGSSSDGLKPLSASTSRDRIRKGVREWEKSTNLTFQEVESGEDVVFGFTSIAGSAVALGGPPPNPFITFDTSVTDWNTNVLWAVAMHEAGHLIGLDHSPLNNMGPDGSITGSIMFPSSGSHRVLHEEDILASSALYNTWTQLTGKKAKDIGISIGEEPFIVSDEAMAGGGFKVYAWRPTGWESWGGNALKVDMGPNAAPYVIKSDNTIARHDGVNWLAVPNGLGKDIGVGADGTVWVIGMDDKPWRFNPSSQTWTQVGNITAKAIDVDPFGKPYIITSNDDIFRLQGNTWTSTGGQGYDVGVGGHVDPLKTFSYPWAVGLQNTVWIWSEQQGMDGVPAVAAWARSVAKPSSATGARARITASRHGMVFYVDPAGNIFRRNMS